MFLKKRKYGIKVHFKIKELAKVKDFRVTASLGNKVQLTGRFIDDGLGNIIQNAVQHAKNKIDVDISWNNEFIFISVQDDGKGFTNEILERIGNPYISNKDNEDSMGLGIFIAKNLIENIGGSMKFFNKTDEVGSVVEISLIRST